MNFIFEQILTGGDRNFGYLLGDREAGVAALVDPSYRPEVLMERADAQGLKVEMAINTHGHADHTNGNTTVQKATGTRIAAASGSLVAPDLPLEDGQELKLGGLKLQIFHTPGHCEDHLVIFETTFQVALTGDHLFVGKIGGTGSVESAREQYESLHRLLRELPPQTTIWPGHDVGCRPSSTLALEQATNPFLLAPDFDAFLNLKSEWAAYKAKQGLR